MTTLSNHDSAVLNALFDPELSLQPGPSIRNVKDTASVTSIKLREVDALRALNQPFPADSDVEVALSGLSSIIEQHPNYASAYNNRAQVRRMLNSDLSDIFDDLAMAISLASPQALNSMVTPDAARVLASAHTHRGFLLLANQYTTEKLPLVSWQSLKPDEVEELANHDFALGGKYGNQKAKQLAVKTNPYAKLCGSIVREALKKELTGQY